MKKRHIIAAAAIAVAASLSLAGCAPTSPEATCKVDDKDHTVDSKGTGIYRVYSSCGVFNVEDAPFVGQWNAADTYASIEVGKTYQFTTYGFRNGFLSQFPNITKATEVK